MALSSLEEPVQAARSVQDRPLLELLPSVAHHARFMGLGEFPTAVHTPRQLASTLMLPSEVEQNIWIKRDDISSPLYGGNKVRTLETLFGFALQNDCDRITSTGAYGSNHAVATVLHAPRVGLEPRAILFPQPPSPTARENLVVTAARANAVHWLPHWAWLPWAMRAERARSAREGHRVFVMPPGGAMPLGALGYVSAALELARQVQDKQVPLPRCILLGVGSTCTSAGLLLGLVLAERFGVLLPHGGPRLVSVRVTPWPVTSRFRIVGLARRTSLLLGAWTRDARCDVSARELSARLDLDGAFLGEGYGKPTHSGRAAIEAFGAWGARALDTTYAAKSAAALLHYAARSAYCPIVYWATKSSVPMPVVEVGSTLPPRVVEFLRRSRPPSV